MNIKDKIKVMQHYASGGEVQVRYNKTSKWLDITDPLWDWDSNTYRIKPEPKYRPYFEREAIELIGKVVRRTCFPHSSAMITAVTPVNKDGHKPMLHVSDEYVSSEELYRSCIFKSFWMFHVGNEYVSSEELLKYYVHIEDDTPCGVPINRE